MPFKDTLYLDDSKYAIRIGYNFSADIYFATAGHLTVILLT
jgi:hypothetical protein